MGRSCRYCHRHTGACECCRGLCASGTGIMLYGALSLASFALGIALIVTKESKIAYALGIVGLIFAVVAIATGGTVGAGIIGTILAVFGARKIDTLWAAYQARG